MNRSGKSHKPFKLKMTFIKNIFKIEYISRLESLMITVHIDNAK